MAHNSLNICFFWHMHQPDYRGSDGVMNMPWVFLHAIKDYYEMPWLLSLHKGLKASFNITSPLIEQLNLYNDPLQNDYFLSLWHKEPQELEQTQKEWLIKTCKSTQYDTMVRPIQHFKTLYDQESLNNAELIDFEVLFILSWCGNYLRGENSLVKKLFVQEKNYTQKDKIELLKTLTTFIKTILPLYATLQKEGTISLSTTPYNHPILPLLLNMENAKYANEHTTIVKNHMSLKEDAIEQVERSIVLYEETFGSKPKGFWPAEGAVDEESISIYKERGIKWIATDEAILFRSLGDDLRENLYKPYDFDGMSIGFRDHGLSDLIGFNYRFKTGKDATNHFMQMIEPISKKEDATVFIILDGENAWEFFDNNAYDFFTELYGHFASTSWCKTVTMDETTTLKNRANLKKLSAGSWIHGNFDTWSGHSEKNRAWELIYQTKHDYAHHKNTSTEEEQKKIQFHFLAAQCSDWFWWYGDDHVTEFSIEFDRLFREHLITIYTLLHITPPADLFIPIVSHKDQASFLLKPQSSISPYINGKENSFFEWLGAGSIDESKLYSTMDRVRGPIEKILYGQDKNTIYLAFQGDMKLLKKSNLTLEIFIEEMDKTIRIPINASYRNNAIQFAINERIELAISKIHCVECSQIHLRFEILQEKKILQTMPGYGALAINLKETYAANWFV